ncbi:hypothetical protein CBP52_15300 [Cellulomonas sp. PSBB021]|nr:hypothetical protein CBP52_15300 [Cellulomonas sp. PSBB021]
MTTQLLEATPRLRRGLLVSRPLTRGAATVYVVKDRANGKAYEVPAKEHFVLSRLDGVRTLGTSATSTRPPTAAGSPSPTGSGCCGSWGRGRCSRRRRRARRSRRPHPREPSRCSTRSPACSARS